MQPSTGQWGTAMMSFEVYRQALVAAVLRRHLSQWSWARLRAGLPLRRRTPLPGPGRRAPCPEPPMTVHTPLRPAWTCTGCGADWPCPTRRSQLTAEYPAADLPLSLYLAACLVEAAYDQPNVSAGELYARFLGWVRVCPRSPGAEAVGRVRIPPGMR